MLALKGNQASPPGTSLVELDLVERNGGTLLRMTHTGLPDTARVASHGTGWAHYLERLAVVAGGGDPGPDLGPQGRQETM